MSPALRVLIVDDNEIARAMLSDYLTDLGHRVVAEAESLPQAVAGYKQHKPDLVTLDISMPDADGRAVLRALRAEDPGARVLIVSGTAETSPVYAELAQAGAAGFLVKPFNAQELQSALDKLPR